MKQPSYLLLPVLLCVAHVAAALDRNDVLRAVNDTRTECGKQSALKLNDRLTKGAGYLQRGDKLKDALERSGYRADKSAVIRLRGALDRASLMRILKQNYCETLKDGMFREIGIVAENREAWIVIAKPFAPPNPGDIDKVAQQVLKLVNAARAKPRRCGGENFSAAGALTTNSKLARAALLHSQDMAKHSNVSHDGSDGSTPGARVTRAGYVWRKVGENVAAGQLDADEVMQGWLNSPHHCANIMTPEFTELGVAYAVDLNSESGIYWTQVFGRPR